MRFYLEDGHRKIEFNERQFIAHVVDNLPLRDEWAAAPFTYHPEQGWVEFPFESDEATINELVQSFVPEPFWDDPEAKRMQQLHDKQDLTPAEDKELRKLERTMLMRMMRR